ncbi:MAG TPA: acyl-CoA dehydrogenase family protein [Mycobacteriales bacterium]|nr:acyl-CoA dehydrogenase family protein [Mycobacteriales bacterium]
MDLTLTAEDRALGEEFAAWLEQNLELPERFTNLDDEMTWGRAWQAKLAEGRWVGVSWPREFGGRGASPLEVALVNLAYARSRAPQPVNRVGLNLAGPTLLAHGTDEQKARWLPPLLRADEIWCQLFSEPGAGSDLASLTTRAEPVDGGFRLSGQKVWSSYAQYARWGICLARTDPNATKHRGISYLVVDMEAPGVTIRPLVQTTGEAEFNETWLDDVFVPEDHLVGPLHEGWRVANTTLAHERGTTFPFKEQVVQEVFFGEMAERAAAQGLFDDVLVADQIAASYVELRLLALHNLRTLTRLSEGLEPGPESSWVKLVWTDVTQHLSKLSLQVSPDDPLVQRQLLWSGAASIAGGTSEVQRTILSERILGLPRG